MKVAIPRDKTIVKRNHRADGGPDRTLKQGHLRVFTISSARARHRNHRLRTPIGGGSAGLRSGVGRCRRQTWRMRCWMNAALVARADQQHAWVLAGDDRGVYGDYRPEGFS